jgi:integrase
MARRKIQGLLKRGGVWHLRTDPVTRRQLSTRCRDVEAALAFRAERERIAADPRNEAALRATLGDWAEKVIAAKAAGGKSAGTLHVYGAKLGHFLRIWGPDYPLRDVTPDSVDQYVETRRSEWVTPERHVTDHTIYKEVGCLVQLLKLAKRAGCYPGDIAAIKPLDLAPHYSPRERALQAPEVTRLLAALPAEKAALAAVCIGLGVRLSECHRMLPTDINLVRGEAFIGGRKTRKSRRTVPILSLYRPLLDAALPYLPVSWTNNVCRDLEAACRRAGIDRCTPNDLRRTHATLLRQAGVDPDVIRRLLGHTTRAMVDSVYAQVPPAELGAMAERALGPKRDRNATVIHHLRVIQEPARGIEPRTCGLRSRSFGSLVAALPAEMGRFAWSNQAENDQAEGDGATETRQLDVWDLAGSVAASLARRAA